MATKCVMIDSGFPQSFVDITFIKIFLRLHAIGKILQSRRQLDNSYDSFAVAIIEDDTNVGHVLRNISVVCDLFLRKGGAILCVVTGPRQYLKDLEKLGST